VIPTPNGNPPGPAIQAIRAIQASSPADPAIQPCHPEKLTIRGRLFMSRRKVRPRADPASASLGLKLRTSCQLRHAGPRRSIQGVTIGNWSTVPRNVVSMVVNIV
jgi:hypothetical protein